MQACTVLSPVPTAGLQHTVQIGFACRHCTDSTPLFADLQGSLTLVTASEALAPHSGEHARRHTAVTFSFDTVSIDDRLDWSPSLIGRVWQLVGRARNWVDAWSNGAVSSRSDRS